WSLGPPLPFRAAPDKGRGSEFTKTKRNVKHNPKLFSFFCGMPAKAPAKRKPADVSQRPPANQQKTT
ncbi:MAG: hypothetical protein Q4E43_09435, partial [Akkermansia sp.]|nr:hypothetical protein [Akkermansia sp.]